MIRKRSKFIKSVKFLLIILSGFIIIFNLSIFMHINTGSISARSVKNKNENITLDSLIETVISRMSIKEKIGQMIIVNYYGDDLNKICDLISNYSISGIILKSENIKNKSFEDVKNRNLFLQKNSPRIPMIISVDQEGGNVARLDGILKSYPSPGELYLQKGSEGIAEIADYTAQKLNELNINMNFSPVIDIIIKTNSIVYNRSFSSNAGLNSELGRIVIDKMLKYNVIAVPKHYPGYGNISADPHEEICRDDTSSIGKMAEPFIKLLNSQAIMSSHVIYSKYDNLPATLSKPVLSYLRNSRFSNVIITDDIQMKSITDIYNYKKAAVEAIKAGCDIILSVTLDRDKWFENAADLHNSLMDAYDNGEISDDMINQSLYRIVKMKIMLIKSEKWSILNEVEKKKIAAIIKFKSGIFSF